MEKQASISYGVVLISIFLLSACQHLESGADSTADIQGHWQLVLIQSMDDRQYVPRKPSLYTLNFEPDGKLLVQADCNRGSSTWQTGNAGQLTISPIGLTRMACPPGSIANRFQMDLSHVRSFVIDNGHLYLATMADGAILEFKPYPITAP